MVRRLRLRSCLAVLPTLLAACGDPVEPIAASLATFLARARPTLTWSPGKATLTFEYSPYASQCHRLVEPVRATMNGAPLELVSAGDGFADGELGPSGDRCTRPSWRTPAPRPGEDTTVLDVSDEVTTARFEVRGAGLPRSAWLESPDAGVREGDGLRVRWAPATDVPFCAPANARAVKGYFTAPDGGSHLWAIPGCDADGLRATVGGGGPGTGSLGLVGEFELGVERCEPAATRCRAVDIWAPARWPMTVPVTVIAN